MDINEARSHLYDLVSEFEVAMLVTQAGDAAHARPMAISHLDGGIGAYLVADIRSFKVDEIRSNPHAVLTVQSSKRYAAVRGELSVVRDQQLVERMWKESWRVWFPSGRSDPNIALLKFSAREGEYWDNAGLNRLRHVYAYLSGETPVADEPEHAKVLL